MYIKSIKRRSFSVASVIIHAAVTLSDYITNRLAAYMINKHMSIDDL